MNLSKINIWILVILLFSISLKAQTQDFYLSLYHPPWRGNNKMLDSILKTYNLDDSLYYKIPITIWIYPTKQGFGPGYNEIKSFLKELNYYFSQNNTGIEFYIADIKVIPSRSHQQVGYLFENFFLTFSHHVKGTINIHLVNNLKMNFILIGQDLGGTYNSITQSIILSRSNIPSGIAHEVGHYFGLLHPHRNWNKGILWAESVSRTRTIRNTNIRNCETRGDFLCDTPAEPDLSKFMDDSCRYTADITDPWGDKYHPNTDNIMSYQPNKKCRKKFTPYQKAVILYEVEHSKFAKYWRNNTQNISFSPDQSEPDDYIQIANLLEPYKTQYHTFNLKFTAKKLLIDKVDFFKYYPSNTNKYYLKISKGKNLFSAVKITIYDNFYSPIITKFLYDPGQITLPSTSAPVLYIKIESLDKLSYGQLFDYKIELLEF